MSFDLEAAWSALPFPALFVDAEDRLAGANLAAEQFLSLSARQLEGRALEAVFGRGSIVADTVAQARAKEGSVMQYNVEIALSERAPASCNLHVGPVGEGPEMMLLIQPTGVAEKMSRSLTHLSAARSVVAMAAMLAHELRNPLAGISGAAQLLAMNASEEDRELTELIEAEARRIGQLIDRVEHFADDRPVQSQPVNIHDVLDRAVRAARAGFGRGLRFEQDYDPSLPEAAGDSDQLQQVFHNLIKNAAEAVEPESGIIRLRTSYQSGVKFAVGGRERVTLPLQIEVIDNGRGIPPSIIADIFDPFVTSKSNGSGLGLPLVSKIIAAHGGLVECDSGEGRTTFTVRLPLWKEG